MASGTASLTHSRHTRVIDGRISCGYESKASSTSTFCKVSLCKKLCLHGSVTLKSIQEMARSVQGSVQYPEDIIWPRANRNYRENVPSECPRTVQPAQARESSGGHWYDRLYVLTMSAFHDGLFGQETDACSRAQGPCRYRRYRRARLARRALELNSVLPSRSEHIVLARVATSLRTRVSILNYVVPQLWTARFHCMRPRDDLLQH